MTIVAKILQSKPDASVHTITPAAQSTELKPVQSASC